MPSPSGAPLLIAGSLLFEPHPESKRSLKLRRLFERLFPRTQRTGIRLIFGFRCRDLMGAMPEAMAGLHLQHRVPCVAHPRKVLSEAQGLPQPLSQGGCSGLPSGASLAGHPKAHQRPPFTPLQGSPQNSQLPSSGRLKFGGGMVSGHGAQQPRPRSSQESVRRQHALRSSLPAHQARSLGPARGLKGYAGVWAGLGRGILHAWRLYSLAGSPLRLAPGNPGLDPGPAERERGWERGKLGLPCLLCRCPRTGPD